MSATDSSALSHIAGKRKRKRPQNDIVVKGGQPTIDSGEKLSDVSSVASANHSNSSTSDAEESVCVATAACRRKTAWSRIEKHLRANVQACFQQLGYGYSEKSYHGALFERLCQQGYQFECTHWRCSVHSETVLPVSVDNNIHTRIPFGHMRSDILVQWLPTRTFKQKATSTKVPLDASSQCFVLELKATSSPLSSASAMQLLAYMRACNAERGLLCNFLQRCAPVQRTMSAQSALAISDSQVAQLRFAVDKTNHDVTLSSAKTITTRTGSFASKKTAAADGDLTPLDNTSVSGAAETLESRIDTLLEARAEIYRVSVQYKYT